MTKHRPQPKVSVCIQTYNHAPYIAQALDSVLMQETDFEVEIIVGEDESQDGTREICIEYERRHPDRIRLFLRSREDVIYIDGRPTGRYNFMQNLKAAQGRYIALLDGDDYWSDPHKLQKQADFLDAHPDYAICFHSVRLINEKTGLVHVMRPPGVKSTYHFEELLRGNFIYAPSVMLRNWDLVDLPDWFRDFPVGDWPLYLLTAQRGKIGYLDEVMAVYRDHGRGVHSQMYAQGEDVIISRRIHLLSAMRTHFPGIIDEREFRRAQSAICLQTGKYYALNNDAKKARRAFWKAVEMDKGNVRAWALWLASLGGDSIMRALGKIRSFRR